MGIMATNELKVIFFSIKFRSCSYSLVEFEVFAYNEQVKSSAAHCFMFEI